MHMCNKSKWLTKQLDYYKCKINNVHSSKIVYNLPGQFVRPSQNCSDKNVQCPTTISSTAVYGKTLEGKSFVFTIYSFHWISFTV